MQRYNLFGKFPNLFCKNTQILSRFFGGKADFKYLCTRETKDFTHFGKIRAQLRGYHRQFRRRASRTPATYQQSPRRSPQTRPPVDGYHLRQTTPPTIRRRLQASTAFHTRRERATDVRTRHRPTRCTALYDRTGSIVGTSFYAASAQ